jgi:hypothetical protein
MEKIKEKLKILMKNEKNDKILIILIYLHEIFDKTLDEYKKYYKT